MNLSIVILSAGAGTRMKSKLPKVLHKISGKEMIYYSIKESEKLTDDISIILYHQFDKIKDVVLKYNSNLQIFKQDYKNYAGTGGTLQNVKFNNDKVLVLNGDMPLIEAEELQKFIDVEDADIVMGVIKLDNPFGYGRVIIEDNQVIKIVEEKDSSLEIKKIKTINSGIYLFKKDILDEFLPQLNNNNAQKEFYLTDIIELAKNSGKKIKPLFVKEENFKGVNSKIDLADAEVIMQNRIKNNFMKNGVLMRLPETIYIETDVKIEGESFIENGVSLIGNTKIINSHIKTNSVIENAKIINTEVGPMARIRPETTLKNSKIGNFVEIKKSTLNGVKAGHLSYLGDSKIDTGTNIGAGTITCNYDGKNKYKTIIGKNVFIGSDSQLIAPITIEDNSMIASGTTVTKDIKSGELAISREKQKNIKNFFYKFF